MVGGGWFDWLGVWSCQTRPHHHTYSPSASLFMNGLVGVQGGATWVGVEATWEGEGLGGGGGAVVAAATSAATITLLNLLFIGSTA